MSVGRMRVLGILFFAEGFFYVAFVVWQTVINRLEFYRAPPLLETLLTVSSWLCLGSVLILLPERVSWQLCLRRHWLRIHMYLLFSFLLWALPAAMSLGSANTYFKTAPESLRPYAYHYLTIGVLFSIIGAINISSMIYMKRLRFSSKTIATV